MPVLRMGPTAAGVNGFLGTIAAASSPATPIMFYLTPSTFTATSYPNAIYGGADATLPNRRFNIYQGTMPVFDNGSFTSLTQRSSDLLIAFKTPVYNSTVAGGAQLTDLAAGPRVLAGIINAATAPSMAGMATWFVMSRTDDVSTSPAIMGSVGLTGSGADLEMPDVNIDMAQTYRCGGFYINFPAATTVT